MQTQTEQHEIATRAAAVRSETPQEVESAAAKGTEAPRRPRAGAGDPKWRDLPWSQMTDSQRASLSAVEREEAKLRDKEQALAKQKRRLAREKKKEEERIRAEERKRDFLAGRVIREIVAAHPEPLDNGFCWPAWLTALLDRELMDAADRRLFGLAPIARNDANA